MSTNRHISRIATLVLVSATALAAGKGWSDRAAVGVRVNGHAFHDVTVNAHDCALDVRLAFTAPEQGYSDPRNVVRNYHRFQARLKFAGGQVVESRIFSSTAAGERTYDFESSTADVACWSKDPNKIVKLDVIGCRGKACDLGAFTD